MLQLLIALINTSLSRVRKLARFLTLTEIALFPAQIALPPTLIPPPLSVQ